MSLSKTLKMSVSKGRQTLTIDAKYEITDEYLIIYGSLTSPGMGEYQIKYSEFPSDLAALIPKIYDNGYGHRSVRFYGPEVYIYISPYYSSVFVSFESSDNTEHTQTNGIIYKL